jgi:hypothetical protein
MSKETADLSTPLRSGRDDNFVGRQGWCFQERLENLFATKLLSRPEEPWASGPPKVMKNASVSNHSL